jgi:hypothetical protein
LFKQLSGLAQPCFALSWRRAAVARKRGIGRADCEVNIISRRLRHFRIRGIVLWPAIEHDGRASSRPEFTANPKLRA